MTEIWSAATGLIKQRPTNQLMLLIDSTISSASLTMLRLWRDLIQKNRRKLKVLVMVIMPTATAKLLLLKKVVNRQKLRKKFKMKCLKKKRTRTFMNRIRTTMMILMMMSLLRRNTNTR